MLPSLIGTAAKTEKSLAGNNENQLFPNVLQELHTAVLASSILSTSAQNSYAPVEWTPEVVQSEQCGLGITSDLSDAIATVVQLIKSNDIVSSLPKSCMEIKESLQSAHLDTTQLAMEVEVLWLSIATWMNSTPAHP